MKYTFEAEDGSLVERDFDPCDVPDTIDVRGIEYRAQFGASRGVGAPNGFVRDERHVAFTLPRAWQDKEFAALWHKWDDRGHAVCEGKRDREELQARMNAHPKFAGHAWNQ